MSKRKKLKYRWRKKLRGSISIFLCLILSPMLTVSLALVEYARYQQVAQDAKDVIDLSGVSWLSDYDEYLHDRFGLLGRQLGASEGLTPWYSFKKSNNKIMGEQVEYMSIINRYGANLGSIDVLKQQLTDVSELTVPAAVAAEDYPLEYMIQDMQDVKKFEDVRETVHMLCEVIEDLWEFSEELDDFESSMMYSAIDSCFYYYPESIGKLVAKLYENLEKYQLTLPEDASQEEIDRAIDACAVDSDEKGIIRSIAYICYMGTRMENTAKNVKSELESKLKQMEALEVSIKAIREKADKISNGTSVTKRMSKEPIQIINKMLDQLTEPIETLKKRLTKERLDKIQKAADEILNTGFKETKMDMIPGTWSDYSRAWYRSNYHPFFIRKSGQLYKGKDFMVMLMKTAHKMNQSYTKEEIADYYKEKLTWKETFTIKGPYHDFVDARKKMEKIVVSGEENEAFAMLDDMVAILEGLFDLDVFFDSECNASLDISTDKGALQKKKAIYKNFLEGVNDTCLYLSGGGTWTKLEYLLRDMVAVYYGMEYALDAIYELTEDVFQSVKNLSDDELQEKILLAGYMRYNLPSRLNVTDGALSGKGLTSFSYSDIPNQKKGSGISIGSASMSGVVELLNSLTSAKRKDKMFQGAELEYICEGTNSEQMNQVMVFMDLYALRMLLDVSSIFSDVEVYEAAKGAGMASGAVYITYMLIEPMMDMLLLMNDKAFPVGKMDCWLTKSTISSYISDVGEETLGAELSGKMSQFAEKHAQHISGNATWNDSAGDYLDYVMILLLMNCNTDTMLKRLRNVIGLEVSAFNGDRASWQSPAEYLGYIYTEINLEGIGLFNPFFNLELGDGKTLSEYRFNIKQTYSY